MLYVTKVKIHNFKCFKDFEIEFKQNVNIIVGDNEAGKSTILEAIHLCLSGLLNGRYLRNELSQYIFNKEVEQEFIRKIKEKKPVVLPKVIIEVYLSGEELPLLEGNGNADKEKGCGIQMKIEFDESYQNEYAELVKSQIYSIPIEYYKISWTSFARDAITAYSIPLKSVIIDSTSSKFQNGSDVYISKIIKDNLDDSEMVSLSLAYRKLKEAFGKDEAMILINQKVTTDASITEKKIEVSVDMSVKNSWESILTTYLNDIPFHHIGKGEQNIIKTKLALAHKKAQTSNLILLEEPENHLSHTNLNVLLKSIIEKCKDKQLIITTHSSFVANKLNLKNLIFINDNNKITFRNLSGDTQLFFEKLSGYQTLRLVLAKGAILVEGPSDELIIQRAFLDKYSCLPIEKGIDVISVGLSFLRFLELSKQLNKKIAVVTDNDGDFDNKIAKKYKDFDGHTSVRICADTNNELNTLEPQIVDAYTGDLANFAAIIGSKKTDKEGIVSYMINYKTDWALRVFSSTESVNYPQYIIDAVEWCYVEN